MKIDDSHIGRKIDSLEYSGISGAGYRVLAVYKDSIWVTDWDKEYYRTFINDGHWEFVEEEPKPVQTPSERISEIYNSSLGMTPISEAILGAIKQYLDEVLPPLLEKK